MLRFAFIVNGCHLIAVFAIGVRIVNIYGSFNGFLIHFHAIAVNIVALYAFCTERSGPGDFGLFDASQLYSLDTNRTSLCKVLVKLDDHRLQGNGKIALTVFLVIVI